MYKYNALVIDDEPQIHTIFDTCKKILHDKYDLNIDFFIINNHNDFNTEIDYDILLVDYNLEKRFSLPDKSTTGDYYINFVRERNKFCRIIFYSSQFIYSERKKSINLPDDLMYKLINEYNVNSIVSKNNITQLIEELKNNCEQIDFLPLVLSKIYDEYKNVGLNFDYMIDGEEIKSENMKKNILLNNNIGKKFRQQLFESFIQKYINIGF